MFAVLLPALSFRGNRSPYLWWFHKLLYELGDQAGYICGDDYFRSPSELFAEGRLEAGENTARAYQYHLPDRATLDHQLRADIPTDVWKAIEALYPANPLAAFKHYCLEYDTQLQLAITGALNKLEKHGAIESVITCVNCTTLKAVCHSKNLPLVHVELGPLRQPAFLQTAYFDFSGVNGCTESQSRLTALSEDIADDWSSRESLRKLFMMEHWKDWPQPDVDLGLCLQVEDDSNILCYANGHSSNSIINESGNLLRYRNVLPPVLVRSHPGSLFSLRKLPLGLEIDQSTTSVDFVNRCRHIQAINSGLIVEAMLLGRTVSAYGDSPFNCFITTPTGRCNEPAFSFFLLNYLVPWKYAFAPGYIRWRLGRPSEAEIRKLHLEGFMQDKINQLESRVSELNEHILCLEKEITRVKSTVSWKITKPLRGAWNLLFRSTLRHLVGTK